MIVMCSSQLFKELSLDLAFIVFLLSEDVKELSIIKAQKQMQCFEIGIFTETVKLQSVFNNALYEYIVNLWSLHTMLSKEM